ncbi:MAG: exodeoxyribonuclease VII large subunit [Bacteroidota bacterium]
MLTIYSVSDVARRIKQVIEGDESLSGLWVRGEISNFTFHTSGHMYFSLKDASARLKCVMFRGNNMYLKFRPADGMLVFAYGAVGVYEKGGDVQLYVEDLMPAGTGSLYLAFLQLRDRLATEGLLDAARKRPLPRFPSVVGVVTSPTGAAVRDIITVISRRAPGTTILLIPAQVQGDDAPESIVKALDLVNRASAFIDVVIVGRGGGSIEDLWAFNDERVARAIAGCKVPVISAVGHETDFTIADFVADRRAPTPSAGAEMAVPDMAETRRAVLQLSLRLEAAARTEVRRHRERLERVARSHVFRFPQEITREHRQRLADAQQRMSAAMTHKLSGEREEFGALAARLDVLSPLGTLARGYGMVRGLPGRRVVRTVRAVAPGDDIEVVLVDGRIECAVTAVEEGGPDAGRGRED